MTPQPITIGPEATAAEAARRMQRAGVNRLPVVDAQGRLVGIVSRDVLKPFLAPDEQIRRRVLDDVLRRDMWMDPDAFTVEVRDGVVTITGHVEQEAMVGILRHAIYGVDGVVRVNDHFTWEVSEREARRRVTSSLPW